MIRNILSRTAELDNRITQNHDYSYLWAIVDHFSKYGSSYAIPNKKAETIWNYMMQVFLIWEPQMLYTDNKKEFIDEL